VAKGLTGHKDMLNFILFFPFSPVIPSGYYYWWKNEKMGRNSKKFAHSKKRKTIEGKICKGKSQLH
jgi:hypothetical protein